MNIPKHRILHIDDDESNRYAVRNILERTGFEVIEADTGKKGLELAETQPDLIILDIRLPDINGYEVCRVIKSRPHLGSIPILQTSATFVSSEDKVEGLESGADGYLSQPLDNAVLVATVRSLLRIRTAEKAAQRSKHIQEDVLAVVSHDLRNPLSVVMLQANLLAKEFERDEKAAANFMPKLLKITQSCQRMNKLIEDLLLVTNLEEGKLHVNKTAVSVNELLNDVIASFEDIAAQKQVRLVLNFDYKKEHVIQADRDRIFQVFGNLISNALRFTPPEGKIEVGMEENPTSYLFHVKDTGAGIPASNLTHIFDRYWQGHKDRNTGVGLGLSIVKGIIDTHDGSVWVESEIGQGASFYFLLPR